MIAYGMNIPALRPSPILFIADEDAEFVDLETYDVNISQALAELGSCRTGRTFALDRCHDEIRKHSAADYLIGCPQLVSS